MQNKISKMGTLAIAIVTIFGFSALYFVPQNASADITNFNYSPTTGNAPLSIFFQVTSTGKVYTVEWNFGDGSGTTTNTSLNATHVYQSAGNYIGTVEVTTTDHQTATQSFTISVTGTTSGTNVGNASSINPDNNGAMTAYQYFLQEHNNTLPATSLPPTNLPPPSYMINQNSSGAISVTITTDKQSYKIGDTITISGTTRDYMGDTPLTVIIRNSIGIVTKVDQVTVMSDKTFSYSFIPTIDLWKTGTYYVLAQYGSPDRFANTSFQFTGSSTGNVVPSNSTVNAYQYLQQQPSTTNSSYTITVTTDKSSYNQGDTIVLSSKVSPFVPNQAAVTIRILGLSKNIVAQTQLLPSSDGTISTKIIATGPLWTQAGTYTVVVQYGTLATATNTFYFSGGNGQSYVTPVMPHIVSNSTNSSPSSYTTNSTTQSKIPTWVKNIFIWYGRGSISDDELVGAIQFLVQQGVIHLK